MYTGAVLKSMLDDTPDRRILEPELIATDRILQRWAVSIGTGLPAEQAWDDRRVSLPPPLDNDIAIVVDQLVMKSPPKTRRFVKSWYRTPTPSRAIAEELGISVRAVYTSWRLSLNFMKYKFEAANHPGLAKLLHIRLYASVIMDELSDAASR